MSCNYCWNQPKKYERYDLYLDGKIKADDFVYRTKNESGEIISTVLSEKVAEIEERLETHFTFNTDYATVADLETAFNNGELKETVIYVVKNESVSDAPDSRDSYNEYMVVTVKGADGTESKTLELIGSGSYAKHDIDVKAETDRATARENELQSVYGSITGYDFKKLEDSAQNIDSRIKKEIKDREDSAKTIEETVESITGYKFEKLQSVDMISEYGWDTAGQDRWSDSKGFDTVIEHTGNLKSILIACSDRTIAGGTQCINVWDISGNSFVHLGTSDDSDVHEQNGELYYTFQLSDIQVKVGDKLRISFHNESNKDLTEAFSITNCSSGCVRININPPSSDFIMLDTNGSHKSYVVAHTITIATSPNSIGSLIELETENRIAEDEKINKKFENYTTTSDLTSNYPTKGELNAVDNKFGNYTTTSDLQSTYATKSSLNDYVQNSTLNNYVTTTSLGTTLNGYVQTSTLNGYVQSSTLDGYVQVSTYEQKIKELSDEITELKKLISRIETLEGYHSSDENGEQPDENTEA